jgi:hypothetical protein
MSNPAAFQATFSDFRVVKGRKVCQWVFETPIEAADAALEALGGIPQPHEERWAAIARIDLKAAGEVRIVDAVPVKERRPFASLPLSQQAALRCNDEDFWKFIDSQNEAPHGTIKSSEGAASFVRIFCGVKSRADITHGSFAGNRWMDLNDSYQTWLREPNYR